jgi:hypothetical protein
MTDIAPPLTPAARSARERREAARRTREWRDRCRVRRDADWAIVTGLLDLEARRTASTVGGPIALRDVVREAKAVLVALDYAPADATAALAARVTPRAGQPQAVVPGPA